jgi:hypothetical protein
LLRPLDLSHLGPRWTKGIGIRPVPALDVPALDPYGASLYEVGLKDANGTPNASRLDQHGL